MSAGGAKDKQTTLNFVRSSQTDNQRNNNSSNTGNTNDDNNNNRSKRGRTEFEQEVNEQDQLPLPVPDVRINASDSDGELFSSESVSTVVDGNEIRRGPIESASINDLPHATTDDKHTPRIIRLERMRDKADRYHSHIDFLRECHKTKVIPKGLRIDIEPSIGNYDEDFCNKWFSRLEEFSLTLISDIIEYSEKIENATTTKIDEETKFLKDNMDADGFKDVKEVMDTNASQRQKRLSSTKRKKYHFLRYNRPEKDRPERQPSNKNITRRQEQTRPYDGETSRRDTNDRRRTEEHRGTERRADRIRFEDTNDRDR